MTSAVGLVVSPDDVHRSKASPSPPTKKALDESDATSLTATMILADSSPILSSQEEDEEDNHTLAGGLMSLYSSFASSTPRGPVSPSVATACSSTSSNHSPVVLERSSDSWMDDSSDDNQDYQGDNEMSTFHTCLNSKNRSSSSSSCSHRRNTSSNGNGNNNNTSPMRPWNIQQALFPEDGDGDGDCAKEKKTPSRRPNHRPTSDNSPSVDEYYHKNRNSWTPTRSGAGATSEAIPITQRRSRRSSVGICMPEHRRRKSTGVDCGRAKYRKSPKPSVEPFTIEEMQQGSDMPDYDDMLDGHQQRHAAFTKNGSVPHSHSKNKKSKQGLHRFEDGLKMSGVAFNGSVLFEEVRHANASNNASKSSLSLWRRNLKKVRLSTLVWGLVFVGAASLAKSAVVTTSAFGGMYYSTATMSPIAAAANNMEAPTGGLRGSLLLATTRRHGKSHSNDNTAKEAAKKITKAPAPKKKEEEKHPKNEASLSKSHKKGTSLKNKQKDPPVKKAKLDAKTAAAATAAVHKYTPESATLKSLKVIKPKPLDPSVALPERRMFEAQDPSMFATPSSPGRRKNPSRVLMLHEKDFFNQVPRVVEQYPAEFTDNTQFYSELDSSDERLQRMERRVPYADDQCIPMQDWQTTFHPWCNGIHELGVENLGEKSTEMDVQLFGTKGYWRYAWKLDLRKQESKRHSKAIIGDRVVLKTLKFRHDFEDAHFEHDRIDAVAMERLTSSPHVINVFGFCGHSVLTEYANGPRLGELADKSKSRPLARLKIARDVARGVADIHGIDGDDGTNATFVHLDVNPANVVSVGGTLKLNDFNIGIIRRWNTTSQEPCGFPAQYPNPQWRSPEEARNENNLTEKVDIFSMGHIFFRLICGHEPWNKLEKGGKPTKEEITAKVERGILPAIPEEIMRAKDAEVAAIRDVMLECYRPNPKDRPNAREIAKKLDAVLKKLAGT